MSSHTYADDSLAEIAATSLAGIGSINWGLAEFVDFNAATELLGTGNAELAYAAVAVGGGAMLADYLDVIDLEDYGN
jgi:uncharacterized membrane protein YuzA (DUF378 family)